MKYTNTLPHIISSSIEHTSIIKCLEYLVSCKRAEVTLVDPDIYGTISPESIKKCIRKNTAIISVMYANNELGTINDIKADW